MAHPEQQIFCLQVKMKFKPWPLPSPFHQARVLDCGSLDINGSNRFLFSHECVYTGIDVDFGRNVNIKTLIHEYTAPAETFDTIICTEALEHDPFWQRSIKNMIRMLKPEGLLIITCAGPERGEHGTADHAPEASPLTIADDRFHDYYKGLTEGELMSVLGPDDNGVKKGTFYDYEIEYGRERRDTNFYGIKW